jgi:hypothetical protein
MIIINEIFDEKDMALNLITNILEDAKNSEEGHYTKNYIPEYEALIEKINTDENCDYGEVLSDYEFRYNMPSLHCPICQMNVVTDSDMVKYLLKSKNLTEDIRKI